MEVFTIFTVRRVVKHFQILWLVDNVEGSFSGGMGGYFFRGDRSNEVFSKSLIFPGD